MKKLKLEDFEGKDQQSNFYQKIINTLYRLFVGQENLHPIINRSIICNTYYQIIELIHLVLSFSFFSITNNSYYSTVQTINSFLIFIVCIIPRISKKHTVLRIVLIIFIILSLASASAAFVLIQNYVSFLFLCDTFSKYHRKYQTKFQAQSTCNYVEIYDIMQLSLQAILLLLKILYIILLIKAYAKAKVIYDQEQTKKRRKDRYNQILLKRNVYTEKRKV